MNRTTVLVYRESRDMNCDSVNGEPGATRSKVLTWSFFRKVRKSKRKNNPTKVTGCFLLENKLHWLCKGTLNGRWGFYLGWWFSAHVFFKKKNQYAITMQGAAGWVIVCTERLRLHVTAQFPLPDCRPSLYVVCMDLLVTGITAKACTVHWLECRGLDWSAKDEFALQIYWYVLLVVQYCYRDLKGSLRYRPAFNTVFLSKKVWNFKISSSSCSV